MTLEINPLDAPLGALVSGYDFGTEHDAGDVEVLRAALDEHLVLVFRNGARLPSHADVIRFCSSFGPLRPSLADRSRLPEHPEINLVSNREVEGATGTGSSDRIPWHADLHTRPPLIEFLFLDAIQIPSEGGDTKWVNLAAAYDALDADRKEQVDDLVISFRLRDDLDLGGYFKVSADLDIHATTQVSLVQVNPRTGQRALWVNTGPDYQVDVVGWDRDEGRALLQELYAHATSEQFVYAHDWAAGDACLWLNTHTMHERDPFPAEEARVLRHVNILGKTDRYQLEPV